MKTSRRSCTRCRLDASRSWWNRAVVEWGTRFVQLYHTDWDHHGTAESASLDKLKDRCGETDRPAAALVKDLKRLGLLDSTMVIWGGEFGRMPMGEPQKLPGRDHHIDAYSMWMAGGGVKPGVTIGRTDEIGFGTVEDRFHVHDLQATILQLLGLDHTKLTFNFQGRNFRLTEVHGNVVKEAADVVRDTNGFTFHVKFTPRTFP